MASVQLTRPAKRAIARTSAARPATFPPFEEVYVTHLDAVFRFCLIQLRDRDVAEDVTADVFSKALAVYARVRPDDGVLTWLLTIARNSVTDHFRATSRSERLGFLLRRNSTPLRDPAHVTEVRDELARAAEAISHLDRRKRVLIGLRVGAELSYAEIGAVMGMSETAARVATFRALESVRQALEETP